MKILLNNFDLIEATKSVHKLGYVPTMGSIHKGHESLIKISKNNSNKKIVIKIKPKGKYFKKPSFINTSFTFNIITTNKNRTATAPT